MLLDPRVRYGIVKGIEPVDPFVYVFAYGTLTDLDRLERVLGDPEASAADFEGTAADAGVWTDDSRASTTGSSVDYEVVGPARLEGLHRAEGRYPTLLPGGSVEGSLLAVDEAGLGRLDAYEGVERGLYVPVRVPLADGGAARVYVGDPDRLGVDDPGGWPGSETFEERVGRLLERDRIVITRRE